MRIGAPLQRCDVVANKRVHHVVGSKEVVAEVLDPLHYGLHTGHARRGGLDKESFREARRLSVSHGVIFLIEPHETSVRPPLLPLSIQHGDETHHHARAKMEGEAAKNGAIGV
jgi:hypothetical protein